MDSSRTSTMDSTCDVTGKLGLRMNGTEEGGGGGELGLGLQEWRCLSGTPTCETMGVLW